jgi:hypothetical protein
VLPGSLGSTGSPAVAGVEGSAACAGGEAASVAIYMALSHDSDSLSTANSYLKLILIVPFNVADACRFHTRIVTDPFAGVIRPTSNPAVVFVP